MPPKKKKSTLIKANPRSESRVKPVANERSIVGNYRSTAQKPSSGNPSPTKRIQPGKITKIKEIRMKEYQKAYATTNQPGVRTKSSGGKQLKPLLSKQARTAAQFKANKAFTYQVKKRAQLKSKGRYRPIGIAAAKD